MNLPACERILIVKPSSLGDIVHTLPAAAALHRAHPGASIDWLVNEEWLPLLEGASFLGRAIPFPRRQWKGPAGLLRGRAWAKRELGRASYDLALDFQGLRRSREGAPLFYDERIDLPAWDRQHAVDRNLALAAAAGADVSDPEFPLPRGEAPTAFPDLPAAPVVLHPFSRGPGKSLSEEETRELCERLAPLPVLLVGVPASPPKGSWPAHVVDLLGKTSLGGLIHLLRRAAWTISVDSGPMHLAAGLSHRVLSLHTWSNPAMVGPWRKDAWIWRDSRLVRVGDLDPAEFPERRDLARRLAAQDRLLTPGDVESIAAFVRARLAPAPSR